MRSVAETILSPRKKSGRRTMAVKMDAPVVKKAQTAADDRGIPVSEYLSDMVRGLVERDWLKIVTTHRAKNKIRHANIPLRVPPAELLGERTPHVLACVYSVFTEGYWSTGGPSAIRDDLCDEGVRLAGELCALMPTVADAHALAALTLLHDSRRATRVDAGGALLPLEEQDRSRWDRTRMARGLDRLTRASGAQGPYLPQAEFCRLAVICQRLVLMLLAEQQ